MLTLDDMKQIFSHPKHDAGHPCRNNRPRMAPRGAGIVYEAKELSDKKHVDDVPLPVALCKKPHGEMIPNPVTSGIRNTFDAFGRRIGYRYA